VIRSTSQAHVEHAADVLDPARAPSVERMIWALLGVFSVTYG